jgi:hypothetical protein
MFVHWKNITAVAAASTALAVLLGWLFWPSSGTPSTAVPLEISTAAPTPPPLTAATRVPTEGLEVVLATLPDPDDDLGRGIVAWGPPMLQDKTFRRFRPVTERDHGFGGIPPLEGTDFRDRLRGWMDVAGLQPADAPELLVALSPKLAAEGLEWESELRLRDVQRGIAPDDASAVFARERRLAHALVDGAKGTAEADTAQRYLVWIDAAEAEESERGQVMWDGATALMADGIPGASFMATGFLDSPPRISLKDHGVMAGSCGSGCSVDIADLMLRDAMSRGDRDWTAYWWACLQNASVAPGAENAEYWAWVAENRAELAGGVSAQLGTAETWQDGLRMAAVLCAEGHEGAAFEASIRFDGTWTATESTLETAYTSCVLERASPSPSVAQRAKLIVNASGSGP